MKNILTSIIFFVVFLQYSTGQDYQLIPDSCTFCFFSTYGGSNWNTSNYGVYPDEDTIYNGNNYTQIKGEWEFLAGIRQDGNKLYGFTSYHEEEELFMDWDANPGDTLTNLFTHADQGLFYDAVVDTKDSVLLSSGLYHHYMRLNGFRYYYDSTGDYYENWVIRWDERGLCGQNLPSASDDNTDYYFHFRGGILFSYSIMSLYADYYDPFTCTLDTLYDPYTGGSSDCENCIPIHPNASIDEENILPIKIYPNPSNQGSTFTIEADITKETTLVFTDMNGKQLKRIILPSDKDIHIIENNFVPGMYIVHFFRDGEIMQHQKLLVQ